MSGPRALRLPSQAVSPGAGRRSPARTPAPVAGRWSLVAGRQPAPGHPQGVALLYTFHVVGLASDRI